MPVRPPHLIRTGSYRITQANSTPYFAGSGRPGVLGQATPFFLGTYDFRPWQGPAPAPSGTDWDKTAQAVPSGCVTARFNLLQTVNPISLTSGRIQALGRTDFMRHMCFVTLASAWDYSEGDFGLVSTGTFAALSGAGSPFINIGIGPDLMSGFFDRPEIELDLCALANGARFASFWVWAVWLGYALTSSETITLRTVVEEGPARRPSNDILPISVPVTDVLAGPWAPGDEALNNAIAKAGPGIVLGTSGTTYLRGALANGGDAVEGSIVQYCGPVPVANTAIVAAAGGPAAFGAGIPALGNPIIGGIDRAIVYLRSSVSTAAGPVIVSFARS